MQTLWKIAWRFLKKLKIELPYDPAIPLLGISPKETKSPSQRDICTPMVTAALFTITKTWKQTMGPLMDEWINKTWCTYNGILFGHKKERKSAICSNMDAPWGYYPKQNTSNRERQILYDLTYMWNLKKMNSQKQRTDWWLLGGGGKGEAGWRWSKGTNFQL